MRINRKLLAVLMLGIFIVLGIAATKPPEPAKFKNLKVLPKNISDADLDHIMDEWKTALGVKCGFCHAPNKDSTIRRPDFASDDKPEKLVTRKMFKMTGKINKKYFAYNKNEQGEFMATVSCMTCHRGSPHPGGAHK